MQITHFPRSPTKSEAEGDGKVKTNFTFVIVVSCLALNTEQADLVWLSLIDYVQTFFMEIAHEEKRN